MAWITFFQQTSASVPTPAAGYTSLFADSSDSKIKFKLPSGAVLVYVDSSVQVIAGSGLNGGGPLSASVTLNVGANADGSIAVNADDIQVGVLATDAQHGNRGGGAIHAVAVASGAAGFMSGVDKAKLDGITPGAGVASVGAMAPATSTGGLTPLISVNVSPGAATVVVGTTRTLSVASSPALTIAGGASADLSADRSLALASSPASAATLVGTGRQLNTTAPITGGGDLSADRTIAISAATNAASGSMSATDKERTTQDYNAFSDFGFVGDLWTTSGTSSIGAGSAVLTDTSNPFRSGDVGKRVTIPRVGVSGAQLTTTILSFQNAGQVTLNASATSAMVNGSMSFGTDNTAAITAMQNAVNNAAFPGARIFFPQFVGTVTLSSGATTVGTNAYGFPTPVIFHQTAQIEGIGGGHNTDSGDYTRTGGTRLAWWGTSFDGGVAFQAFINISPTGVQSIKRPSFRHCWLDCRNNDQNQALFGLKTSSCHGTYIADFFVIDALAASMRFDISTSPTEAQDNTRWLMSDIGSRQIDNPPGAVTTPFLMTSAVVLTTTPQSLTVAANSLPTSGYIWTETTAGWPVLVNYTGGGGTTTLTGCTCSADVVVHTPTTVNGGNIVQAVPGNGCAMVMDGGATANTCCAAILQAAFLHGTTWGPAAIETRNSDSIDFISVYINGGSSTNDGAINRVRKPGVRLNGSIVSANLSSRNITFRGGSAGVGGVSAMGLNNAGARLLSQSGPNYWDLYQLGNGETIPIVEGNAYFDWNPNGGWRYGQRGTSSVASQAIAAATLTLITGTLATVPPQGFQLGTQFRWTIIGTAAAAGTAANTITVRIGTNGTTADAAVATFTTAVGTAAASEFKIEIVLTVQGPLGAAAAVAAECMILNSAASGFVNATVSVLSATLATFNSTTAQQFISVCLTTGASKTVTIKQALCVCENPANP